MRVKPGGRIGLFGACLLLVAAGGCEIGADRAVLEVGDGGDSAGGNGGGPGGGALDGGNPGGGGGRDGGAFDPDTPGGPDNPAPSCTPIAEAVQLELPRTIAELAASFANRPDGEVDQLLVMVSTPQELGFRRFDEEGTIVRDPPAGQPLILVSDDRPASGQYQPQVVFLDSTRSAVDARGARFQYSFITRERESNFIARGQLVIDSPQEPRSLRLPVDNPIRGRYSLIRPASTLDTDAVVFRDDNTLPRLQAMMTMYEAGSVVGESVIALSDDNQTIGGADVAALGTEFLTAYAARITDATLEVRPFGPDGAGPGSFTFERIVEGQGPGITNINVHAVGTGAIVVWLLAEEERADLRLLVLSEADIQTMRDGGDLLETVRAVTLETPGGNIRALRTFAHNDELGIAAVIDSGAEQQIWLYRLTPDGREAAPPSLMVTDRLGPDPQYALVDNESGYGLVWRRDGGGSGDNLAFFLRYECQGL